MLVVVLKNDDASLDGCVALQRIGCRALIGRIKLFELHVFAPQYGV